VINCAGVSDCAGRGIQGVDAAGLGELAEAAKNGLLGELAWGGLKAGTKFGEPSPLFPRAEKEAIERMQSLEDENNRSAVGSAGEQEIVAPERAPSATSVSSIASTAGEKKPGEGSTTATTAAPANSGRRWKQQKFTRFRRQLASSRLSSTPASAAGDAPLFRGLSKTSAAAGPLKALRAKEGHSTSRSRTLPK